MNKLSNNSLDSIEAGAPADEIEITPAMIEAGLAALEEWIVDGASLVRSPRIRGQAVSDIYKVMRRCALSEPKG